MFPLMSDLTGAKAVEPRASETKRARERGRKERERERERKRERSIIFARVETAM